MIAAGIGITPLRALIEELRAKRDRLLLIYRARSWEDVVFKDELEQLVRDRRGAIHYIIGRRGAQLPVDPLSAQTIRRLVPDVESRDVFICGPAGMMERLDVILRSLGLSQEQIHFERFALI